MLDAYRDLIDELLETPSVVRNLVGDRQQLPPATGSLIASLRDRDRTALERLQAIMREPDALLAALAEPPSSIETDAPALIAGLDTARGELVSLLMNLALKDWERTATHEIDGEITLADEVERHVDFDEDRLDAIRTALTASGSGEDAL